MIRINLLIMLLINSIFAATLLNQNIYDRENRVDLMLSFDTPFNGKIKKSNDGKTINIFLSSVQIQQPFFKELQNSLASSITITKADYNSVLIKIVPSKKELKVEASRTIDRFGLRLRILPVQTINSQNSNLYTQQNSNLNLNDSTPISSWRYWVVIAILLILLAALLFIKYRGLKSSNPFKGGWLMPKQKGLPDFTEANVKYQKPLDRENRLVLIEFNGRQYLMLLGKSNILLDTFTHANIIEDEDGFNHIFETNRRQLNQFLKENHPDAYEAFKKNASKDEVF